MVKIRKSIIIFLAIFTVFGTFTAAETMEGETSIKAEVEDTPLTALNSPDMDIMRGNTRNNLLFFRANGAPSEPMEINLSVSENLSDMIELDQKSIILGPDTKKEFMVGYTVSVPETKKVGKVEGKLIFEPYDPNLIGVMSDGENAPSMEVEINVLPTVEEFREKPEYVVDHDTEYVTNETEVEQAEEEVNTTRKELEETREKLERTLARLEEKQEMLEGRRIAYYEKVREAEENSTEKEELEDQLEQLESTMEDVEQEKEKAETELKNLEHNTPAGQITASGSTLLTFIPVFFGGLLFGFKVIPGIKEKFE